MGNQQGSLDAQDLMAVPLMDGYFISADGEVWSKKRTTIPKKLGAYKHLGRSKYPYLRLKIAGKLMLVHRVVASVLIGRPLETSEVVNHKNGDTTDNRLENLEVVSQRENVEHAVRAKLYCHGKAWRLARGMQEC